MSPALRTRSRNPQKFRAVGTTCGDQLPIHRRHLGQLELRVRCHCNLGNDNELKLPEFSLGNSCTAPTRSSAVDLNTHPRDVTTDRTDSSTCRTCFQSHMLTAAISMFSVCVGSM